MARLNRLQLVQQISNHDNTSAAESWVDAIKMAVESTHGIVGNDLLG